MKKMHFSFDKSRHITSEFYENTIKGPGRLTIPVRWEEGEEVWGEHVFWFEVDFHVNDDKTRTAYIGLYRYNENDTKMYQVITEDIFMDIISGIENVIDFNKCDCKYVFKAANPFEDEDDEDDGDYICGPIVIDGKMMGTLEEAEKLENLLNNR